MQYNSSIQVTNYSKQCGLKLQSQVRHSLAHLQLAGKAIKRGAGSRQSSTSSWSKPRINCHMPDNSTGKPHKSYEKHSRSLSCVAKYILSHFSRERRLLLSFLSSPFFIFRIHVRYTYTCTASVLRAFFQCFILFLLLLFPSHYCHARVWQIGVCVEFILVPL